MSNFTTPKRFSEVPNLLTTDQIKEAMRKGTTRIIKSTTELAGEPNEADESAERITHVVIGEGKQDVYRADIDEVLGGTSGIADIVADTFDGSTLDRSGATENRESTAEETVCLSTAELTAENEAAAKAVAQRAESVQELKTMRERQIAHTLGMVEAIKTYTDWENYLRGLAHKKTKGSNITAGADFVLDMRKRDEAITEWEKTAPEGIDIKPHEIPESDRLNLQIDQLKKLLTQVVLHTHDVGDFICSGASFDTGPRIEIREKNERGVIAVRHEKNKTPQTIVISKPQTNLSPKEIRRQIGQLKKNLALAKKIEDLCEKLRNLSVDDVIISKSGTRRKITGVNEDSATFTRNGEKKEHSMSITETIERHLYAFEDVISVQKPSDNDRDLFKTHQL